MTHTTNRNRPASRRRFAALLLSASGVALAVAPASAQEVIFSDNGTTAVAVGQRTTQLGGVTQVRLASGVMLSFVDRAEYTIETDGTVDLHAGSVTVAGAEGAAGVVRMPDGVQGTVAGAGSAASFRVAEDGQSAGHTLTGAVTVARGRNEREFGAGEHWASAGASGLRMTVSSGVQTTPSATNRPGPVRVAQLDTGGPVAAAQNGLPVSLGDALAAAGASSDILGAARSVEAAAANPDIATFPSGDLALLVAAAGQLEGVYGGTPFPQAQADIIRTYLEFLANGGSGANFLSAYAGFVSQYLNLLRSGARPSSFDAASVGDINAFLAYRSRLGLLGQLAEQDRVLVDAYLAFLAGGGNANDFAGQFTDLVEAYFAFVRNGGDPADFTGASAQVVEDYIAFLDDSGLLAQLSASNRALLAAYLANGGLGFVGEYRSVLDDYFVFLAGGNLPSDFSAQDTATLQAYLEALQAAGLLGTLPAAQADFFADYLAFVQAGGNPDAYAGLNANIFAGYVTQLQAYYDYLLNGGVPSDYSLLTQQQIAAYVAALEAAGATGGFLPDLGAFYTAYAQYLTGGGNPDIYTGLPVVNLPVFADALNAYANFLAAGGLPSDFTATELEVLANYLAALDQSGQLESLLGANAGLLNGYFAFLAGGGNPDLFAGLPVYADYVGALQTYFAFLDNGGLPGDYTALTQQQIQAYLSALASAGGLSQQLGNLGTFYTQYFAFLSAGGNPNEFAGLPLYDTYASALQAYFAFLAGGGLPADYTALTQQQITAYLAALNAAGGFNLQIGGDAAAFYASYFAYLQGGGSAGGFAGLPVYANYVTALNAYFAFLAGGGLPGDYTALDQATIEAYLAALAQVQGGFGSFAGLNDFFDGYYAFIQAGGDPAEFGGIPVYADYLAAIADFYAFLANGGLPSGYTALTQEQVEAYLAALSGAGLLASNFQGEVFTFLTDYFAFLAAGGVPDQFGGLQNGTAPQLAGINAWVFGTDALRTNTAADADIDADGRITRVQLKSQAGNQTFDYTSRTADLREFGRIGNAVAWSRYYVGNGPNGTNVSEHLLVGTPATNMPTSGIVSYDLVGGTAPNDRRGTAGSTAYFTGELAVAFGGGAPLVGLNFDVLTQTEGYRVQTTGGAANPLSGGMGVNGNGQFENQNLAITSLTASTCNGFCQAQVFGGLFGAGASAAGFTYNIFDQAANNAMQGVAVFGIGGTPITGLGTPPAPVTTTLQNQSIAYANKLIGDDVYTLSEVTYNADGIPIGYVAAIDANDALTSGNMTLADTGIAGNGAVSWARWSNGTPGGKWYNTTLLPVGPDGGYHVIAGAPLTNLPANGAVAYDLVGFTTPTRHDESTSTGSVSGGAAVVFGASPVVALDLDITSGADSFNLFTNGKLSDPTQSTLAINPVDGMFHTLGLAGGFPSSQNAVFVESAAAFCGASCTGFVEGFLAGDGASHMGLAYSIRANTSPNKFIDGTAAFAKGDAIDLGGGSSGSFPGGVDAFDTSGLVVAALSYGDAGFTRTSRTNGTAVDADGGLNSVGSFRRGSASADQIIGDEYAIIGRWVDGTTNLVNGTYVTTPNDAVHWAITNPSSTNTFPLRGEITYDLLGATTPTYSDGRTGPGTFDGSLTINWMSNSLLSISLGATVTMPDATYDWTFQSPNFLPRVQGVFESFVIPNGVNCTTSNCQAAVSYNLGGAQLGERWALNYNISINSDLDIGGSALFGAPGTYDPDAFAMGGDSGSGSNPVAQADGVAPAGEPGGYMAFVGAGGTGGGTTSAITVTDGQLVSALALPSRIVHTANANTVVETDGDQGVIGWQRIENVTVEHSGGTGQTFVRTAFANQSWHTTWGTPVVNLPASGLVNYELIGSTKATQTNAQGGNGIFNGAFAVDFGTLKAGLEANVDFAGTVWGFQSTGGVAAPSMTLQDDGFGARRFSENLATTRAGANHSRTTYVEGFLAGDGATHAGLNYSVRVSSSNAIQGSAAFRVEGHTPDISGSTTARAAGASEMAWARWSVPATGSVVPGSNGAGSPPIAPGLNALANSGIQFSAAQLERLNAYLASQID